MTRTLFALGITSILALSACSPAVNDNTPGASSSSEMMSSAMTDSSAMLDSSASEQSSAMMHSSAMTSSAMMHSSSGISASHLITIETSNFKFTPNMIKVKKGEKVTLVLKGMEGNHGFMIEGLGINVPVGLGQTVMVTLPTDTAGTFNFRCSVPCGPGHMGMTGQIVIE